MSEQQPPDPNTTDATGAALVATSPTPMTKEDAELVAVEMAIDGIEMWRFHHMKDQYWFRKPFTEEQKALVNSCIDAIIDRMTGELDMREAIKEIYHGDK